MPGKGLRIHHGWNGSLVPATSPGNSGARWWKLALYREDTVMQYSCQKCAKNHNYSLFNSQYIKGLSYNYLDQDN